VFENRFLRRIFRPKKDEVTGECTKLHSEKLDTLYSSPNIIKQIKSRRLRLAGRVTHIGEKKNMYKVLMGKPDGKRPLERPRRRWEDGTRMDLTETGWRSVLQLAQDKDRCRVLVNVVVNLRVLAPRS
jgi:hypothetical protein